MNDNNVNQNVAPEVNPTVAPVDATPATPAEVPVAPVAETPVAPVAETPVAPVVDTPVAPVEVPVQPVAPAPEPQPMPAGPEMDPNAQFSVQPTEQPVVQPAVQPGVPPVAPDPAAQPVAQPVGDAVVTQPKKKNNLPFILIVILLLAVIGGLAAFLIFNNVKSDDSSNNKTKTEEKNKKDDEKDIPQEIADRDKVTVGEYEMKIPVGYTLYGYESGATILIDKTNKVQLTLSAIAGASISTLEADPGALKSTIEQLGYTVSGVSATTVDNVKWFCATYSDPQGNNFMYIATDLGSDAIEGYIYNAGAKSYTDIVKGVNEMLASAEKKGSSFAEKRNAYDSKKMDLFYYDIFK